MKTGNPAKPHSDRLEARVSPELKQMFQRAAELQGITLSDFLISSLRQAAVKTLQEHETVVRLSDRDAQRFAQALINPPPPSPRLRAAARRYHKITGA